MKNGLKCDPSFGKASPKGRGEHLCIFHALPKGAE